MAVSLLCPLYFSALSSVENTGPQLVSEYEPVLIAYTLIASSPPPPSRRRQHQKQEKHHEYDARRNEPLVTGDPVEVAPQPRSMMVKTNGDYPVASYSWCFSC